MTLYLLDVASYQGSLALADVVRAGFGAVNLKISHGLTRKSVHPDVTGWVERAKAAGLGISTFHYLTADATGVAQAEYAYARIAELGLLYGTAHQLDVESAPAPALAEVRAYLERMTQLLGRPPALYTGDWWWTARSGWNVADLTPYLWAAPNAGYLKAYPGDTSSSWTAGYGGWPSLSVMQFSVGPLPGGTIDVSKSAIRDVEVWRSLTQGRSGMSYPPATLVAARKFYMDTLKRAGYTIDPDSVGIVGDDSHANAGTSYHLGKDALKSDAYSIVESSRDRNGLTNAASALDLGNFSITVKGKVHNLRTFSVWLVAQCKAGTADTADIREVIYSDDGKTVKRWDRLGRRTTGDSSHLLHTHESWFRDSENRDKTAHLRRYFTEIGVLEGTGTVAEDVTRQWIVNVLHQLIRGAAGTKDDGTGGAGGDAVQRWSATGGDLAKDDPNPTMSMSSGFRWIGGPLYQVRDQIAAQNAVLAKILANVAADDAEAQQIIAAIESAQAETVKDVIAGLAGAGRSDEDVARDLVTVLGNRAPGVAAALARLAG